MAWEKIMSEIPKITPKFSLLPGGLTGFSISSYSMLPSVRAKGYQNKINKGKRCVG